MLGFRVSYIRDLTVIHVSKRGPWWYKKPGQYYWPWSIEMQYGSYSTPWVNTLRLRENGRHFQDDLSKCISLNENVWILIKISLKFVPKGPINNNPALVQIMAWRRSGDKPLSEPMIVSLLTNICGARPQWVNLPRLLASTYLSHMKITDNKF